MIYQYGFSRLKQKKVAQFIYPVPGVDNSMQFQDAYPSPYTESNTLNNTPNTDNLRGKSNTNNTKNNLTVNDVQRISVIDAKQAFDDKKAIFVDVRSSESFNSAHIPGAISLPEADIMVRMNELEKELWIIPYCS